MTAGSSPKGQTYGYIFNHCRFIGSEPNTCYLGRPWREYAKVVILNSEIGDHIKPEGWHDWGKIDAHDTVYFAEYKNYGPGAAGLCPSWTHTLTDTEAENYTYTSVFSCAHIHIFVRHFVMTHHFFDAYHNEYPDPSF